MEHARSQRGGPQNAVNVFLWELGWNLTPGGSACPHKGDCVHINITAAKWAQEPIDHAKTEVPFCSAHMCKMFILDSTEENSTRVRRSRNIYIYICWKMLLLYHGYNRWPQNSFHVVRTIPWRNVLYVILQLYCWPILTVGLYLKNWSSKWMGFNQLRKYIKDKRKGHTTSSSCVVNHCCCKQTNFLFLQIHTHTHAHTHR